MSWTVISFDHLLSAGCFCGVEGVPAKIKGTSDPPDLCRLYWRWSRLPALFSY